MSNQKQNNRPRGPMGHGMRGGGEKAKDFKGTMKKTSSLLYRFLKVRSLFLKNQKASTLKSVRVVQTYREDKDKDYRLRVPLCVSQKSIFLMIALAH